MNPILKAALEVQTFFDTQRWKFCFIGGLTVLRWGEARTTQDVDVSLMTSFGQESSFIETILEKLPPRFPDAGAFGLETRTLLVNASNDIEVDISLAAFPFEERVIQRSSYFDFASGCRLLTCSAEDLVIYKVFAGRTRDWLDVEGILKRHDDTLDWNYIDTNLPELCELKGVPENVDRLKEMR